MIKAKREQGKKATKCPLDILKDNLALLLFNFRNTKYRINAKFLTYNNLTTIQLDISLNLSNK